MRTSRRWRFFRAGGVDQVTLASGEDLLGLSDLDQKLWAALACPTRGLILEPRTLDFVDSDHDGRIRPPEILAAIAWAADVFASLDELFEGGDRVKLSAIGVATATGRDVLAGAKRVLANLGKPSEDSIALADVSDTEKIFANTKYNGDGIVPSDASDEADVAKAIEDVISVAGSLKDRSGRPGVDQALVDGFFERAKVYADWLEKSAHDEAIQSLGDVAAPAAQALDAVRTKIDDYFMRCRLAALDGRVVAGLNVSDGEIAALAGKELVRQDAEVAKLPLARVEASRPLALTLGLNPAWTERMKAFTQATVVPLLGARSTLSEADWALVQERLGPYESWLAAKPNDPGLEKLGADRIHALAVGDAKRAISELIARDSAVAAESNQIEAVEKMIRYRRDLVPLLRNFVNLGEFYGKRSGAFQNGTLYIDGRSCDLCLPVHDVAKHASLAGLARAYLAYCECRRRKDEEKQTIVAVITGGDVDNLLVGRNGVFYDRKGDDWDATITRIIENPISVRQAFWAPYKRFMRLVEEQIAKRASAADSAGDSVLRDGATKVANADQVGLAAAATEKKPAEKKVDVGTVAAIGVAIGGIATFFSSVLATFLGLGMWMPVGLLVLLLAISGPSMLIAWLKLRQRNIGPILDANGWAVNAFARINIPFGAALTGVAALPKGAIRALDDPFAEKSRPWTAYFLLALVVVLGGLWAMGKLDALLPDEARASSVLHWPEAHEPKAAPGK